MSGMDELVTWLRARLDDDERVARAATYWGDLPLGHLASDLEAHLIHWMPPRVLAEVEAKRRILDAYEDETGYLLRLLALPYADRPGYREEWRP